VSTKLAVNLPVKDLAQSTRFFAELGFAFDQRLANENVNALVINDDTYVLLVAESQFKATDEEVHTVVNDLERPVGTYLYGRRMYEVMVVWETMHDVADQPPVVQDFAQLWQAADKIVYSTTLETVSSARTRIARVFDPEAVRQMKARAGRDLTVGGPALAGQALKAGLVDECHLFVAPLVVGGGTPGLPTGVRLRLDLLDERRFRSGMVHLHYRLRT
jgi:dihydrofolate reductase